jgi:hypothetical protein
MKLQRLVTAFAFAPCLCYAQAVDPGKEAEVGSVLLNPSSVTITGHFETAPSPTTLERALRSLREQMDQKQAAEAAQSPLEPLWKSPLWKYLPSDPGGTLNSPVGSLPDNLARTPLHLDDPFCTAAYLTLTSRILDREVTRSDQSALWFFSH